MPTRTKKKLTKPTRRVPRQPTLTAADLHKAILALESGMRTIAVTLQEHTSRLDHLTNTWQKQRGAQSSVETLKTRFVRTLKEIAQQTLDEFAEIDFSDDGWENDEEEDK